MLLDWYAPTHGASVSVSQVLNGSDSYITWNMRFAQAGIFLRQKPEASMRRSLERSTLRILRVAVMSPWTVQPEQNVDESHPS